MNQSFKQKIFTFLTDESGPTAVEYAVMLALIIVVCIASVGLVGDRTDQLFDTSGRRIRSINNN